MSLLRAASISLVLATVVSTGVHAQLVPANPTPITAGTCTAISATGQVSNTCPYSAGQAASDVAASGLVATPASVATAQATAVTQAVAAAPVQSVNGNTGAVAVTVPTNAQITTLAQAISGFTSINIAMPNGGHLQHPIFIGAYPTGLVLSGTAAQSVFSASGAGSLTMAAGAFNYLGAQFELRDAGIASTGLANVATETASVSLSGTTLATQSTLALPINVGTIPFTSDIICTVMATGATGKVGCHGSLQFGSGLSSVSPFVTYLVPTTPVTIDLTQALTWDAKSTLSSTIGSPSITVLSAEIWQTN